jgi:hypothetical protein
MEKINQELLEAAKQVLWKLSHNHDLPDYKGPGRITRQDATVKMLYEAVEKAENRGVDLHQVGD